MRLAAFDKWGGLLCRGLELLIKRRGAIVWQMGEGYSLGLEHFNE